MKQCNRSQTQSGHTLVEMLVSMVLITLFMVLITQIFVTIMNTRLETRSYSHVAQDGRYILSRLAYDIRRAEAIVTPGNPGDSGTSLVLTIDGSSATYSLVNGKLRVNYGSGNLDLNGSGTSISSLGFQRLGSGTQATIQTTFVVTSVQQEAREPESRSFQTTVGIR